MKKYKITYTEGNTINKTIEVEGKTMCGALMVFLEENPNAIYERVEVVREE